MVKPETQIKRFKKLRKLLGEVGPDHFDMDYWLEHDPHGLGNDPHTGLLGKVSDCNTVGCAAGWTCVLVADRPVSVLKDEDGGFLDPLFEGGMKDPSDVAAKYLGVDPETKLFIEGGWPGRFQNDNIIPAYYRLLWLLDEIIKGKVTFDEAGYGLIDSEERHGFYY